MESFNFIESAIIFGIKNLPDLRKVSFSSKEFSLHGEAFSFLQEYFDTQEKFPTQELLLHKFPSLDSSGSGVELGYSLGVFRNQVLFRKAVGIINSQKEAIKNDPTKAITTISSELADLALLSSQDVFLYDGGDEKRLEEYERKEKLRQRGLKILGILTPFQSINKMGLGWQPGEVISLFARPTVGKTWLSVKVAATAIKAGAKVLFVTTEMPREQIYLRMDVVVGNMMGYKFSHSSLRRGEGLNKDEYKKFLKENSTKKMLSCDHIGESSLTMPGIISLVRKHKPDLIVLDGIHLVETKETSQVWEKMHKLFYDLKRFCVPQNVACFVSTQANRKAADLFTPPHASEVAFGDALLQASDIALSMCKVEGDEKQRLLQIQKYRDGVPPADYFILDWDVDIGKIEEQG